MDKLLFPLLILVMTLSACSTVPVGNPFRSAVGNVNVEQCERWIEYKDKQIKKHNSEYTRIDGIPWLRTDRFWATYGNDTKINHATIYQARVKLGTQAFLDELFLLGDTNEADIKKCIEIVSDSRSHETHLSDSVKIKDHYSLTKRTLGLYPLLDGFALKGILDYQKEFKQKTQHFQQSKISLLKSDNYQLYTLDHPIKEWSQSDLSNVFSMLYRSNSFPLGFISDNALQQLFRLYAPTLIVESNHVDDAISAIQLSDEGKVIANREKPIVYTYHSYTKFRGKDLLQLNYGFWFPSRPSNDVYGGFLDGILWRATLDTKGNVLLYDSIHQCGCYHKYFIPKSQENVLVAKEWDNKSEPAMIFSVADDQAPTLIINSVEHYILSVNPTTLSTFQPEASTYELQPYISLNRLASNAGNTRASLFRSDGLVSGSERGERFYFWSLGIKSAGAMRQKGSHATAFVGRQHFDDPDLLEQVFE